MSKSLKFIVFAVLAGAFCMPSSAQTATPFQGEELLPPDAEPGECYTRVFVAPTYRTETEEVLKKEASERIEIIPARFEWVEETVTTRGPSERLEEIPATYEWVEEQVLVSPESTRIEEVPAVYETVSEQVLERPAHTIWKKGRGPVEKVNNGTGEILCLVEVPATYKTVTKRVQVNAATTREVVIAEKYETVRKKVMKTPPTFRTVSIPAEHDTVKVKKLVTPAETKVIPVSAEYQTYTKQVKVTEGRMEWRRILCETNLSGQTVMVIQRALQAAGHNPGDIDGKLGRDTISAMKAYQQKKGLPVGSLTYETLDRLGVNLTVN